MKKLDELKEIRGMDVAQSKEEISKLEREMLNLQFRKATNGVPKPSELKRIRRRIARIETVLRESELTDRSFSA